MQKIKIRPPKKVPDKHKYPFEKMALGQSFSAGDYSLKLRNQMNSLARHFSKRLERKYIVRKEYDYVIIWRKK